MADGDFLGGLFGGVKDAGSALYGLLGGPSGTPSAGNTPTDIMQQLSPEEQRRLTASTLGQLGATLLAAGQKQMPAQRAQALAQLGNIGPNIDMQLQRAVAVRNQQEALRRQNELFPMQREMLQGQITQQQQQLAMQRQQMALQQMKLQRDIQFLESQGLDASGAREQLRVIQQMGGGIPGGVPAGGAGAPAPAGSSPALAAGASIAPGAAVPQQGIGYTPSQAAREEQVTEPGFTADMGGAAVPTPQQAARMAPGNIFANLIYLDPNRVSAEIGRAEDKQAAYAKLLEENEKAKQEQFKFERDLAKEFRPTAERFREIQKGIQTMGGLASNATGVSDSALIIALYKIFDPSSVVSTNESGQIMSATGKVDDAFKKLANAVITGERLTPKQREDIIQAAKSRFKAEYEDYERTFDAENKKALGYGVNAVRTVQDVRDPAVVQEVQRDRDIDRASKTISAKDVLSLDMEGLGMLRPEMMSKAAKDAYKARVQMLTRPAELPAGVPQEQVQGPIDVRRSGVLQSQRLYQTLQPRERRPEDNMPLY